LGHLRKAIPFPLRQVGALPLENIVNRNTGTSIPP
jgi:hypothetical protein